MLEMKSGRGWYTVGFALLGGLGIAGGCSNDVDGFSTEEWNRVKAMEPLMTAMPTNIFDDKADDDAVAKLGQKLFYEKDFSEAITQAGPAGAVGDVGKVGCVTCHDSKYFADSRVLALSHGRTYSGHNTPAMVNLGWNKWTLWVGSHDSLMSHGAGVWGTSATTLAQAHFLYKKYRDEYNAAFPDSALDPALDPTATDATRFPATANQKANAGVDGLFEKMTRADQWKINRMRANLGKAFDAYPRKLITRNSRFEKYIRGDDRSEASFSSAAKNGLKLFIGKASCIDCHNGPLLADNQFHNVGVPGQLVSPPGSTTPATPDRGRGGALGGLLNTSQILLKANAQIRANAIAAGETLIEGTIAKDEMPIFNGTGQFSADSAAGLARLVQLDNELCLPGQRRTDAQSSDCPADKPTCLKPVAATCAALFRAPNPLATPTPDLGDPRFQVCLDANVDTAICADLDEKGAVATKYDPSMEGAFRTPSLLNVAETPPYFHTGLVMSLRDVVQHYNQGGGVPGSFVGTRSPRLRPLLLSDREVDDIVEFLKTLTGDLPDASWACNPLVSPTASPIGCGPPGSGTGGTSGAGGRGGASGAGGRGGSSGTAGAGGGGGRAAGSGGMSGTAGVSGTGGVTGSAGTMGSGGAGGEGGMSVLGTGGVDG
jgi:cytochrome c peroxidase